MTLLAYYETGSTIATNTTVEVHAVVDGIDDIRNRTGLWNLCIGILGCKVSESPSTGDKANKVK